MARTASRKQKNSDQIAGEILTKIVKEKRADVYHEMMRRSPKNTSPFVIKKKYFKKGEEGFVEVGPRSQIFIKLRKSLRRYACESNKAEIKKEPRLRTVVTGRKTSIQTEVGKKGIEQCEISQQAVRKSLHDGCRLFSSRVRNAGSSAEIENPFTGRKMSARNGTAKKIRQMCNME